MSSLWLSIQPMIAETRLMLSQAQFGAALRARLPPLPHQPCGLRMLLEGLAAWYGQPLGAVLDADAEDVLDHPERWSRLLGELDGERVRVEWGRSPGLPVCSRPLPGRRWRLPHRPSAADLRRDGAAMITPEMRAEMRRLVLREGWKIQNLGCYLLDPYELRQPPE